MARERRNRGRVPNARKPRWTSPLQAERLERRQLLSYADGNGPVVTSVTAQLAHSGTTVVVSFDGPLDQNLAQNTANYQVSALAPGNPEIVTRSGPTDPIVSALYDTSTNQVTLTLARSLTAGTFYRLWINGTPGSGVNGHQRNPDRRRQRRHAGRQLLWALRRWDDAPFHRLGWQPRLARALRRRPARPLARARWRRRLVDDRGCGRRPEHAHRLRPRREGERRGSRPSFDRRPDGRQ
jgi:hypothetical protein